MITAFLAAGFAVALLAGVLIGRWSCGCEHAVEFDAMPVPHEPPRRQCRHVRLCRVPVDWQREGWA